MREVKFARWASLIIGILLIAGGILNLINPWEATISVVQIISVMFIAVGFIRIVRYFSHSIFRSGSFLIAGFVDVALGLIMIQNLSLSALAMGTIVAFWILLNGITELATAIDLKNIGLERWWLGLVSGGVGIVLGFLLVTDQALSAVYLGALLSLYMFMMGLNFISVFFAISRFKRYF